MRSDEDTIKAMIKSPDRESRYLAVQILRKDSEQLTKSFKKKTLAKISLEDRIKDYSDICEELGERELTIEDFSHLPEISRKKLLATAKLDQIKRLVNGDWVIDFTDNTQILWYPYFSKEKKVGLAFVRSSRPDVCFFGAVALFKTEQISDFVGTTFTYLYQDLI